MGTQSDRLCKRSHRLLSRAPCLYSTPILVEQSEKWRWLTADRLKQRQGASRQAIGIFRRPEYFPASSSFPANQPIPCRPVNIEAGTYGLRSSKGVPVNDIHVFNVQAAVNDPNESHDGQPMALGRLGLGWRTLREAGCRETA